MRLIEVGVGEGGGEVPGIEDAGVEAALPQASAATQAAMGVLRVLTGDVLHETADGAVLVAGDDQVDVKGVSVDRHVALVA